MEREQNDLRNETYKKKRDDNRDDAQTETKFLQKNDGQLDTPDTDKKPEGQATRN